MLDSYIEYLISVDNKSIIAKIYGVFTISTNVYSPVDFVIMQNTSKMFSKQNNRLTFDLKGSLFNRKTNIREHFWTKQLHCDKQLKDVNFLEIRN